MSKLDKSGAMPEQEYLSAKELSARLAIPQNTLYFLAKHSKTFPAGIKIGRARRWKISEIEAYLAGQSQHEQD